MKVRNLLMNDYEDKVWNYEDLFEVDDDEI